MITFVNNESTKFCQITLHIKRFIQKRKVVPFFCLPVYAYFLDVHHGMIITWHRTVLRLSFWLSFCANKLEIIRYVSRVYMWIVCVLEDGSLKNFSRNGQS